MKNYKILFVFGIFIVSLYLPKNVSADVTNYWNPKTDAGIFDCDPYRRPCPEGYACLKVFGRGQEPSKCIRKGPNYSFCTNKPSSMDFGYGTPCKGNEKCIYEKYSKPGVRETGRCIAPSLDGGAVDSTTPRADEDEELVAALDFLNTSTTLDINSDFIELIKKYRDEMPVGEYGRDNLPEPFKTLGLEPGQYNNLMNGANETACGGYQDSILKLLLSLKFSDDSSNQGLLKNLDFGPIQIAGGGHQAVVVFPRGTDWRLSGIVLDPWGKQKPKIYNIEEWQGMFAMGITAPTGANGSIISSTGPNSGYFPTTPDENGKWTYNNIYSNKPILPAKYTKKKTMLTSSPILPLVASSDGKRVGMDNDGKFVNDFGSGVDVYILKKADGTYSSTITLPEGEYTASLSATGSGEVHVFNHLAGNEKIYAFNPIIVKKGENLSLVWKESENVGQLKNQAGKVINSSELAVSPKQIESNKASASTFSYFWVVIILIVAIVLVKSLRNK